MPQQMKGIVPPPYPIPERNAEPAQCPPTGQSPAADHAVCVALLSPWWRVSGVCVDCGPCARIGHHSYLATHFDSAPKLISPEFVFYFSAVVYCVIGWRWYCRDWRARWVAIFMAGASVALNIVNLLADRASGMNQLAGHEAGADHRFGLFNLLICLYLAFYPGMHQTFRETPWE